MTRRLAVFILAAMVVAMTAAACRKSTPPVARPTAPTAGPATGGGVRPPAPPEPIAEPVPVPAEPIPEDVIGSRSLDELNRDSPLTPVFYELDSAELSAPAQQLLQDNAQVMRKYTTWQITIEGHCDERGTAEYNLALGERRAATARDYLVSLGIPASRLKTVSYGKEFPFDSGHHEGAWAKNRRAHFVITAK